MLEKSFVKDMEFYMKNQEQFMMENGLKTSEMVKENRSFQINQFLKVFGKTT